MSKKRSNPMYIIWISSIAIALLAITSILKKHPDESHLDLTNEVRPSMLTAMELHDFCEAPIPNTDDPRYQDSFTYAAGILMKGNISKTEGLLLQTIKSKQDGSLCLPVIITSQIDINAVNFTMDYASTVTCALALDAIHKTWIEEPGWKIKRPPTKQIAESRIIVQPSTQTNQPSTGQIDPVPILGAAVVCDYKHDFTALAKKYKGKKYDG